MMCVATAVAAMLSLLRSGQLQLALQKSYSHLVQRRMPGA
jgi:hypothetical protein